MTSTRRESSFYFSSSWRSLPFTPTMRTAKQARAQAQDRVMALVIVLASALVMASAQAWAQARVLVMAHAVILVMDMTDTAKAVKKL